MRTSASALTLSAGEAASGTIKLSVNVDGETGTRLRNIAYRQRLSESSIVQIALKLMFAQTSDDAIGPFLRQHGASLRRES